METVAKLTEKNRNELFSATSGKKGITEVLVEKDFWVCLLLKTIFENNELNKQLIFKGGTALSKCYKLINRFSEDVDLILDWQCLGITDEDAWKERSGNKQNEFNKRIDELGKQYIKQSILPCLDKILKEKIGHLVNLEINNTDKNIINVKYPPAFSDKYLLDYIKLEIGPRASRIPKNKISVCCYAAEEYPDVFKQSYFMVDVIKSERTFWEKATILHQIASVDENKPIPPRYSRHYYDLYQMIDSPVKEDALKELDLLKNVTNFKMRFYRSASAKYELAKSGTFKLLPSNRKWEILSKDYDRMKEMIFGKIPSFSDIKNALEKLENEINEL